MKHRASVTFSFRLCALPSAMWWNTTPLMPPPDAGRPVFCMHLTWTVTWFVGREEACKAEERLLFHQSYNPRPLWHLGTGLTCNEEFVRASLLPKPSYSVRMRVIFFDGTFLAIRSLIPYGLFIDDFAIFTICFTNQAALATTIGNRIIGCKSRCTPVSRTNTHPWQSSGTPVVILTTTILACICAGE